MRSSAWAGDWPITQDYGPTSLNVEPRYQGGYWHCGIDVGCPSGTPLYAVRAGKVTIRTSGILGIQTSSGTVDYYVHGHYTVFLGMQVVATDPLGYSDAVIPGGGSLTGPHLHFEVQPIGVQINTPPAIDPRPLLWPETYQSGGGTVVPDMTPEEHNDLLAIAKAIPANLITRLDALQAGQVAPPPATVDLTPVLAAIATLKGELDLVKATVEKIDRGD